MDILQHRYYRIPKILMMIIGQWPYQTAYIRYGTVVLVFIVSLTMSIPLLLAAVEYHNDVQILMDCIIAFCFGIGGLVQLITLAWNSKKMLQLLDCIRADWLVWAEDQEIDVLHEYAERGMKITILYTVVMFLAVTVYNTEPIIPKIIDVILHNGTRPGQFPIPIHFHHLDVQKYYFCITIPTYVCVFMVLTVAITYNITILLYVQHGCAIFAAVGNMLERIGKYETSATTKKNKFNSEKRDREIEHLICLCIVRHNAVIEYVKVIEAIYSWTFLIATIMRTAVLSITEFQIVQKTNQPQETAKFVAVAIGLLIYVFMESYVAHVLSEHSISIRYYIQRGEWYRLSLKAQKLLQFMLMRCNIPFHLTAGKLIKLSVESFVVFLKTSMTYLTVLRTI